MRGLTAELNWAARAGIPNGSGDASILSGTLAQPKVKDSQEANAALRRRMQAQAAITSPPAVFLLSRVMRASDQPTHAGPWGLARSARAEASLPVHCIDRAAATVVEQHWALAEPEAVMRHDARLVPGLARAHQAARTTIAPAASAHMVTGGTGGLGLLVGQWLVERGAGHVVLLSRNGRVSRGGTGNQQWVWLSMRSQPCPPLTSLQKGPSN